MTNEQTETILNAYRDFLNGDIDYDQYHDVRRMILDELMKSASPQAEMA